MIRETNRLRRGDIEPHDAVRWLVLLSPFRTNERGGAAVKVAMDGNIQPRIDKNRGDMVTRNKLFGVGPKHSIALNIAKAQFTDEWYDGIHIKSVNRREKPSFSRGDFKQ